MTSLFGQQTAPPLQVLRAALPPRILDSARAQIGAVSDTSETFEATLGVLSESADGQFLSCLEHNFRMSVMEMCECTCGELLEPMQYKQCATYVSVPLLLAGPAGSLTAQLSTSSGPDCPVVNCGTRMQIQRYLMQPVPTLLTIALVWDPTTPGDIAGVLQRIEQQMDVTRAFKGVAQPRSAILRGLMCQHGARYCAFFFDTTMRNWMWFDDAVRTPMGSDWAEVAAKCALSRYQPSFLFYSVQATCMPVQAAAPSPTTMPAAM